MHEGRGKYMRGRARDSGAKGTKEGPARDEETAKKSAIVEGCARAREWMTEVDEMTKTRYAARPATRKAADRNVAEINEPRSTNARARSGLLFPRVARRRSGSAAA